MRVRTEARREAILGTAATAFMELGYEGTSMAEIATRAKCTKPTLYGYFASKEELFLGVIEHGMASTAIPLLDELSRSIQADPRTVLARFGERWLAMTLTAEAIAIKRLILAQVSDPELARRFWEIGPQRYLEALESYLVAATEAGQLKVRDPSFAAQQLAALYEAGTNNAGLFADDRTFTPEFITRQVSCAVDTFLAAFGTK
ncbi:hypothetical protein IA69_15370 [Massilia sp. JS1662]|nr:TetR/AcrR family transcriptional regulator [Massilia sp. JS1662]KGF80901.1 hypothetical protein IA69_15370 [Massilia sp. JS1662]